MCVLDSFHMFSYKFKMIQDYHTVCVRRKFLSLRHRHKKYIFEIASIIQSIYSTFTMHRRLICIWTTPSFKTFPRYLIIEGNIDIQNRTFYVLSSLWPYIGTLILYNLPVLTSLLWKEMYHATMIKCSKMFPYVHTYSNSATIFYDSVNS